MFGRIHHEGIWSWTFLCWEVFDYWFNLLTSSKSRRRQWHPTPVPLPRKSHGWRSLKGCSPWGRWGLYTTERLPFHFSLSCIGEGNGNPLQCSCLENPRDREACWASVYGVVLSRTRLKWLSNSNSSKSIQISLSSWFSLGRLSVSRNLFISSRMSKMLAYNYSCCSVTQ